MAASLAQFFTQAFRAHPRDRAYGQRCGYRMQWFTYTQILEMASHFAGELHARQIIKGDRVMLWAENSAEWVAAFFGCAMQGVIVVPMDDAASPDFALHIANQVEAKLWLSARAHAAAISQNASPQIPQIFLEDLPNIENRPRPTSTALITPEDVLQIVFTSGTTATPKGVVITHGNVLANIAPLQREMQRYLKYEHFVHPVRFLTLLPLSHVFGQFMAMFLPPLLGGAVIFQDELKPSEIIGTVQRERVSVLVAVPQVLQSLKQKIERDLEHAEQIENFRHRFQTSKDKHFLHRSWIFRDVRRRFGWKFWAFICGGAALDSATEEFWGRLGYAAIQGYGLTETTSLISVNHPFKLGKGSIGKVLPGRELKLAEDGEILIRGSGVTTGYWKSENSEVHKGDSEVQEDDVAVRKEAFELHKNDGWFHTGDIGALDEAGNLYFKGRKKEIIVTPAGLNIYPEDLEAALRAQLGVKDAVVVGIDREGNSEPCAVIIVHNSANAQESIVRANQALADFQRIRKWLLWPEQDFPRTSTLKPRRSLIKEFATRQILHQGERNPAEENPIAELIERINGKTSPQPNRGSQLDSDLGLNSLGPSSLGLSSLGLSSLDRVELISALEDRYQIDLSETRFSAMHTVADIERLVAGEGPPSVEYHYPQWALRWPVTWLRWLAHCFLLRPAMLLAWPRIEGRENLKSIAGPLLIVCNHISDVDVAFIQTALPARLRNRIATATRGEALEALRTTTSKNQFATLYNRMKWLLGVSLLNLFPLPREAGFRQSFAYAGRAVDRGYSVLIFPEGRHTVDGNINQFRAGIGLLVNNLNIPVLPMRIEGLFELKQVGKKFVAPGKIRVRIGRPINFPPATAPEEVARALKAAVEAL